MQLFFSFFLVVAINVIYTCIVLNLLDLDLDLMIHSLLSSAPVRSERTDDLGFILLPIYLSIHSVGWVSELLRKRELLPWSCLGPPSMVKLHNPFPILPQTGNVFFYFFIEEF